MNKLLALITDLHWGCRNDLVLFFSYFEKFYTPFIMYLVENNIKDVFILGDVFDRRKFINFKTLAAAKEIMFNKFKEHGITVHIILGNHDIHYRDSLFLNSPELMLTEYDNIIIYNKPTTINFGDTTIDMIPWICKENQQKIFDFVHNSKSDLCFGHFEFSEFPMYKGIEAASGIDPKPFQKYELVCSGHYHTRSKRENVVYLGTPYEMNWQDYGDDKGFHIFNLETRELSFHVNTENIFYKLYYDESAPIDLNSLDLRDTFVRLIVLNKTDFYKFDQFINQLYTKSCYDIKIVEDMSDTTDGEIGEEINLEDTLDVLTNYVSSLSLPDSDVEELSKFMKALYLEAINIEVVQ